MPMFFYSRQRYAGKIGLLHFFRELSGSVIVNVVRIKVGCFLESEAKCLMIEIVALKSFR